MINKLRTEKKKNENWVSKTLNKRKQTPYIVTIIVVLLVVMVAFFNEYLDYQSELSKKEKVIERIEKAKAEIKKIERLKEAQLKQISLLDGLSLDATQPVAILGKVCDLLKNRDVIGSYYIKKSQNKSFANVLDIEIQVSYGDKELLFLIMKIVSDKLFYLKNIKRKKIGVIIELYKPKTKG
jgi:Icc-related predicted phosphoesterase